MKMSPNTDKFWAYFYLIIFMHGTSKVYFRKIYSHENSETYRKGKMFSEQNHDFDALKAFYIYWHQLSEYRRVIYHIFLKRFCNVKALLFNHIHI